MMVESSELSSLFDDITCEERPPPCKNLKPRILYHFKDVVFGLKSARLT